MGKKNENHEQAMQECLDAKREFGKLSWCHLNEIAERYGYKSGETLRCTFTKWCKEQEKKDETDELLQEEKTKKYQKQYASGAGQGYRRGIATVDDSCNLTTRETKEILKEADIRCAEPISELLPALKKDFEKGITVDEAMKKHTIDYATLESSIDNLRKSGMNIQRMKDQIYVGKFVMQDENILRKDWRGEKIIRFGVVTDTQFGSKYQQPTLLHNIYNIFEREGIHDVYHAGDISEGIKMRKGHEQECFLHGSDDIEDYIVDIYPKHDGITTHFITGNHDHSIIKQSGHDIGVVIGGKKDEPGKRKDMKYLGMSNARIYLTPKCIMELNHPIDGAAYALSYSIQKYADSLSGGHKPNILINGHHHKAMYLFYRNIHLFEGGCFQAQTPFMRGNKIAAHVGGYIITLHVAEDGEISRCVPEFIPFYETIEHDY
jgi:UDP-2,3-diacylglucosamine pyrophosphatase LpxH